jgi:GDP-L-fucose synthase
MSESLRPLRVFVAGHRGMVGSAICRRLAEESAVEVVTAGRNSVDLTHQTATFEFLWDRRPDVVILAAARVGGIGANSTRPADFIWENLAIESNVIHGAFLAGVPRLLFMGSSCIYPRDAEQPIRESALLSGPLEPTNRPYAIAKIAGVEMCWAYNRQHGARFLALMPTNLYGPGDNYDLESSHVIPALLRKFAEAKQQNANAVVVWGTGVPRREFLHVDDLAEVTARIVLADADLPSEWLHSLREPPIVNVGSGEEVSIRELAALIAERVGFSGAIQFDDSKPDGTPRKLLDCTRLKSFTRFSPRTLRQGLAQLEFELDVNRRL